MFGINLPGVTWNSWYNPLDNVASVGKQVIPVFGQQNGKQTVTSLANAQAANKKPAQTGGYPQVVQGAATVNNETPYSSGGGSGGSSSYDPAQIAQFDQGISQYEQQLNRLPTQLGIAQGNINRQFSTSQNELKSGFNQAQNTYNTNTNQNQQQYVTNKNQINDTASAGLRGLLRTLGAYGAGGGSDANYVAPGAVATQASQQRSGAGETFGQNQQGLDTSWGNFGIDYSNQERKLNDWRTQQLNNAESTSLGSKQTLLSKLAELRASRAAAAGGNPTASAQPFLDQINSLQGTIDQLGVLNPTYNGTTPVYNAPDVSSYLVDPNATVQTNQSAMDSVASPYLQMLLGKKRENQARQF